MRRVPKTLAAALVALLLALGMAACGGGDDSDSTTEASGQQQSQTDSASQGGETDSGESDSSSGDSADGESGGAASGSHDDSGGGSGQFKVKGGDNSVQEFGEEANSEEFDAAAAELHSFLDARAEGDWDAACESIAQSVVEAFEKLASQAKQIDDASCAGILENLTNPAAGQLMEEEAAEADVGSLRIEGDKAFVIYTGTDGTVMAMPMANEDGDWKVASLAGTPLS